MEGEEKTMTRRLRFIGALAGVFALLAVAAASAETYGNTTPFETQSAHAPNYVLGVEVDIPVDNLTLESFGMMYGHENLGIPANSNAIFGLYTSNPGDGLPETLVAVTDPINLNAQTTYDNIPFTSTPVIDSGTYWMRALYESTANPRMSSIDGASLVAYWSELYANGMPANAPASITYTGQNFNYWVNGSLGTPTGRSSWSSVKSLFE